MKKEENLKRALLVIVMFFLILFIIPNVLAAKPYCGDGKCSGGETPAKCPQDCGCVPHPETCNNFDDNCNSLIDENLFRQCGVTDVGACEYGVSTCSAGIWGSCVGNIDPSPEVCEGSIDENCNGVVDEGCQCINGQTQQCGTDVGGCQSGTQTCSGGLWGACVGEIGPTIETCNNIDDDCNSIIDNGLTQLCGVSDVGACQYGVSTCSAGVWGSCVGNIDPTTEVCNGIDDDCNGITDDGFDQDACIEKCSFNWTGNGGSLNCCGDDSGEDNPYQPTETITDGRDNDCDGSVDEGGTDYTDRTCNVAGSASSTKVKCGDPLNKNEDSTDATSDSCVDGTINSYMHIEDIFVDATKVLTTDTVQVTCNVCCYSSGTEYAILYNSGSGWQNKQYGNCISGSGSATCTAIESKTINIPVDDVSGTHYFRCWESYSSCDANTKCCSSSYADNDDMSVEVIESGGIPEIIECKLLSQPNKFYVLNQDIVQSLDETCIVISAENTTIDCKGHSITSSFNRAGIYSYARNTTIKNCDISMGESPAGRGIELNGANNSYVYNNTLNGQGVGLFVINTNNTIIEQNIINSVIYGIYLTTSNENILKNNALSSNLYGIYLTTSNENILKNNALSSNLYGIYLTTSNENILESNKLSISTYAVYIRSSLDVNITRNTMNLNHYGIYLSSINKYQFNGNELNDNLNTDIINTKFISESTERIYNKGQQISFDLNITHINGSSSDDFIYDVSIYPGEEYTAIKNNNILTISFTPTKEGLYSLIANITTSSGNTEIRKFIFLVGNINSGIIRYYFHDDPSTHGQPFDTPWVGQDYGSMLSYPVDKEEYRTCGEWVQFHPDEILKPLYIIKNVSINWWYKASADPYDPYTPHVGIERYATPSEVYDYMVLIPSTLDYTWGQVKFTNLNLTSDYLWRPYWLGIKLGGKSPFVMSNSSNPSYADFTYLYAGPKIEKFKGIGSDLINVNLLSSVFKDDSKNNAFLQLKGQGTFNLVIQMPDIAKNYEIKMDGVDCLSSSNCELNSQLNGKLDLNLILNGQHILEIIYEAGGTDYTDKTCNIDGSASSTKVKCVVGTLYRREDYTNATSNNCADGISTSSPMLEYIDNIFVDATTVLTTDTVQVKCQVKCYSSSTEYAILYNNGSGWVNKQYGNCIGAGLENKTISVPIDDIAGTHYFRCWESYSGCTAANLCCSSTYADNDDMSINVI